MKRFSLLTPFLAGAAGALVAATLLFGQSVSPIRFDEASEVQEIPDESGALTATVIRLTPLNMAPITCDVNSEGALFVKNDDGDVNNFFTSFLCQCRRDEDLSTYSWQNAGKISGACGV